jgi:hypothetical protein
MTIITFLYATQILSFVYTKCHPPQPFTPTHYKGEFYGAVQKVHAWVKLF